MIKLRLAKINLREKSTGRQFAKLNPREMFKKKKNPCETFFSLRYLKMLARKHETDSVIKHNEYLAEHTIINEISKLLFKYKHGNNIHEDGKQ